MEIKNIKHYDDILKIIYKFKNHIIKNYNSKKDQILIEKPLVRAVLEILDDPYYDKTNKTKLIKALIKDILKLKNDDLIILKEDYIFIKIYDDSKERKVSIHDLNSEEDRYNGLSENDLEAFYNDYFTKDDIEELLNTTSKKFVKKYFIDATITNDEYERSVFKLIQKLIITRLEEEFESNTEFYIGFSGYIFRKNFIHTFELIADYLLEEVADSNKNVLEFLEYYTHDIIVKDGEKYKVPELKAQNGLKWHVISMVSILKPYVHIQNQIIELSTIIKSLNLEIASLFKKGYSPIEYNLMNRKKIEKILVNIEDNKDEIDKIYDSMHINQNSSQNTKLDRELELLKYKRENLKKEKFILEKKTIDDSIVSKYEKLVKQKENYQRDMKVKYKILKQNQESYKSIRDSLSKSLMSKKQFISKSPVV